VARPKSIASLHEAKYEWRFCDAAEKAERLRIYKQALAAAANEFGVSEGLLEASVASDFGVWMKQERMPKLPDQNR
jgi:hypothetical protein